MIRKTACVVLAAGNSTRFKKNKLNYEYGGVKLIDLAFSKIPKERFEKIIVVSQYSDILKKATKEGFTAVLNSDPDKGQSHSIQLGLDNALDCTAVMFMVCDQPLLKKESIEKLLDYHSTHKRCIVSLSSGKRDGNPCIFPQGCFNDLMSLEGDCGGKKVIENFKDIYRTVKADDIELTDIDTPEDIEKLIHEENQVR